MGDAAFLNSVDDLTKALAREKFLATKGLSTALFLSLKMKRPLLLEGLAGCGKTEVARTLAPLFDTQLIRLQCYDGIDTHEALYDWNYSRQLLHLRATQSDLTANDDANKLEKDLYTNEYLLERPLLKALRQNKSPILLLDELDRADVDFEAFLLEFLEEFQVTIPEIGTIKAEHPPIVIITSNRTRELHDALKRRCVYHWVDLPDSEREEQIIRLRLPEISDDLAHSVATAAAKLRQLDLLKQPGVSETVDWARAIHLLAHDGNPTLDTYKATLSTVLKDREDYDSVVQNIELLLTPRAQA